MVLADVTASFNFGEIILGVIWFFFLFIFIWIFITLFADLFRDHSLSGWAKAGWVILLVVLPLLGSLIYLIARGKGMAERAAKQQAEAKAQFDQYVRETAAPASTADELAKLAQLKDSGAISEAEFEAQKAKLLG